MPPPPGVRILLGVAILGLFVGLLFWAAGGVGWITGWGYLGVIFANQAVSSLWIRRRDPDLLRRRGRIGEGTGRWDAAWLRVFGLLYVAIVAVGALDAGRFGWARLPAWVFLVGLVLCAGFNVIITWAMTVNTYFEKTVRIQKEIGHRVVDTGPYRIVRHPGYAGTIPGFLLATPLLLRSGWAFVPALVTSAWMVLRTAYEDRFLRRELPGYEEYAERVRYRLVPGIW